MKRSRFLMSFCSLVIAALIAGSCAGMPGTPQKAATAPKPAEPQKVKKERLVTVKVPVLVKETSLYPDGLVDQVTAYKYDGSLKLLVEKAVFDGSRPDPIEKMSAESAGGRVTAESTFDAEGKLRLRREYSYTAAGLVATEKVSDAKGNPQSASSYAYDAEGNKVEWKVYDGKAALKAATKYSYAKGKLVLIEMSDGQGAKTGSIALEYDGAGLLAKKTYKAPDGSTQKYEVYAWTAGRLTLVENHRADGSISTKIAYTYGDLGQVLSQVTTDSAGAVKDRRTYEYSVREDQKTEVYWE